MRKRQEVQTAALHLEDLDLREVLCHECGKPIPSIPSWLSGAKVKFQCERCRAMHPRVPGMAEIDGRRTAELDPLEVEPPIEDAVEEEEEEELDDELEEDSSGDSEDTE